MNPATSSRAEVQAFLFSTGSCPTAPCGYDADREACWNTCATVTPLSAGACTEAIATLMSSRDRPSNWHSCLETASAVEMQSWLAAQSTTLCPRPCVDPSTLCIAQPDTGRRQHSAVTRAAAATASAGEASVRDWDATKIVMLTGLVIATGLALCGLLVGYRQLCGPGGAKGVQQVVQGEAAVIMAVPHAQDVHGGGPVLQASAVAVPVQPDAGAVATVKARWETVPTNSTAAPARCMTPRAGGR